VTDGGSARPSDPSDVLRRILVGYDGSPASVRAAQLGIVLARAGGGGIWFVHAHERDRAMAEPLTDEYSAAPIRAISRSMASLVAEATSHHLTAESLVREGSPPDVLVQMALEVGATVIVVGTRGLGGAARLVLGSVSSHVVGQARVPVIVVP